MSRHLTRYLNHFVPDSRNFKTHTEQDLGTNSALLPQNTKQQVFSPDIVMPKAPGFLYCKAQNIAGIFIVWNYHLISG